MTELSRALVTALAEGLVKIVRVDLIITSELGLLFVPSKFVRQVLYAVVGPYTLCALSHVPSLDLLAAHPGAHLADMHTFVEMLLS